MTTMRRASIHVFALMFALANLGGKLSAGPADVPDASAQPPEQAAHPTSTSPEDVDLLYLADQGPLVIRLHPRLDGKSYATIWGEYINGLFRNLDANGDGLLTPDETAGVPTPAELATAGLIDSESGRLPNDHAKTADQAPRDGKISTQELIAYFRDIRVRAFSFRLVDRRFGNPGRSRRPESELFEKLDRDGDLKLSRAELKIAHASLRKYDRDDDEIISVQELWPARGLLPVPRRATNARVAGAEDSALIGLRDDTIPATAIAVLEKYDRVGAKGRDGKLSAEEIDLEPADFARLDVDADQKLNLPELRRYLRSPVPSVELTLRGGSKDDGRGVEVVDGRIAPKWTFRPLSSGQANLMLTSTQIDIDTSSQSIVQTDNEATRKQIFARTDVDNNGYLDLDEVRRFPNFRRVFDAMDRNPDDKVFEKEMLTYVKNQVDLARARTVLTVDDQGQSLIEILDVNRDLRFARRELIAAQQRLKTWDKDGDGTIAKTEIPRQFRLTLDRGRPDVLQGIVRRNRPSGGAISGTADTAPAWFRKMDRNRDGDLSRREFLGSAERFRQFDKNDDGLIDPAESSAND